MKPRNSLRRSKYNNNFLKNKKIMTEKWKPNISIRLVDGHCCATYTALTLNLLPSDTNLRITVDVRIHVNYSLLVAKQKMIIIYYFSMIIISSLVLTKVRERKTSDRFWSGQVSATNKNQNRSSPFQALITNHTS